MDRIGRDSRDVGDSRNATLAEESLSALAESLSQTAEILFSAGSVRRTLQQVVALAVDTIEGCDYSGLFLIEDGVVVTPVRTDPLVEVIDALQRESQQGPCLDAIAQRAIVYADDLRRDVRWPAFASGAARTGIRSVLALPLTPNGVSGSINLYARYPAAFGVVDRAKGVILASLASIALATAHSLEDEARRIENLHSALRSREVIGQAQGILMERERIAADQAFEVLRRASQFLHIKLREVAQNLVDTGERPQTGSGEESPP